MNSFKDFLKEQPKRFEPRDRGIQPSRQVGGDKMVDFEAPAYNHGFNKSVRDSEKWPPKPEADYNAKKKRWAVSDGKKAGHLEDS